MPHRLIIRASAEAEITDAVIWYQHQQAGLGQEFLTELQTALDSAVANPRQYPRLRRKPEVRRVLTGRFPYRVFFVVGPMPSSCLRFSIPPVTTVNGERPSRSLDLGRGCEGWRADSDSPSADAVQSCL